jgi:lipopolysaccharide export system protein LptC
MLGDGHVHRFATEDTSPLDITSEKLIVYPDDDIIETDLPAVVIQGDSRLVGTGMKYDNNTRKLDVYASSGVRIAPKDMSSSK